MKNLLLLVLVTLLPFSALMAQGTHIKTKEDAKLEITINESKDADVYIDGKKYDHSIIDLLDTDKIASIDVLKGERALSEYNAPNGVIIIKTKAKSNQIKIRDSSGKLDGAEPLIIIDGVTAGKGDMEKMDPSEIYSISVLKGEEALKKYKEKDGVIIITTKTVEKLKKKKE